MAVVSNSSRFGPSRKGNITIQSTGVAGRAEPEINVADGNPVIVDVIGLHLTPFKPIPIHEPVCR